MLLYVDNKNRIMAVHSTGRTDLTEVKVDETSDMFPFSGWSDTRICCYKIGYYYPQTGTEPQEIINEETGETETVEVPVYSEYAEINMFTPYVPTHMMSALENLEKKSKELREKQEEHTESLALADETTIELYEAQMAQEEIIMAQDESIIELYELYNNL